MKRFFAPNLERKGRWARGLIGLALIGAAPVAWEHGVWLTVLLACAGLFGLFEALRGWCALRACGIKTKL